MQAHFSQATIIFVAMFALAIFVFLPSSTVACGGGCCGCCATCGIGGFGGGFGGPGFGGPGFGGPGFGGSSHLLLTFSSRTA
uniref:Uncharacterized protein n=2 Tax=Meloidogyne TaxID=189290 RepID=A0A6V7WV21_MELEN|nr:unnamed protein product [Meloidogyne enterolobii]